MTTLLLVEDDNMLRGRQASQTLTRGAFTADRERMQVLKDGEPLPLTLTEYKILTLQASAKSSAESDETKETVEKQSSPLVPGLAGGCGALLFALLAQGILLRRKLHRLEEEKL